MPGRFAGIKRNGTGWFQTSARGAGPGPIGRRYRGGKDLAVLAAVALIGGDEVQGAVAVGVVAPGDEATHPDTGLREALEGPLV